MAKIQNNTQPITGEIWSNRMLINSKYHTQWQNIENFLPQIGNKARMRTSPLLLKFLDASIGIRQEKKA